MKNHKKKRLLLSYEKIRNLDPRELWRVRGGACGGDSLLVPTDTCPPDPPPLMCDCTDTIARPCRATLPYCNNTSPP